MAEIQRDIEPQSSLGKQKSTRIVNNADENDADMGPTSKRKRMTVVDETTVQEVIQFVKKQRPSVVDLPPLWCLAL